MSTTALDHELVGAAGGQLRDELAVDLQVVERQVLEVVEGAEAGAEVVEREAAAELAQPLGELARAARMLAIAAVSVTSKIRPPGSTPVARELASMSVGQLAVADRAAPDRLTSRRSRVPRACSAISSIALRTTQRSIAWTRSKRSAM